MDTTENSFTQVEVSIKARNEKGGLIEVANASSKLTKADAGIESGSSEETIYVSIQPGAQGNYNALSISMSFSGKLTKADAGFTS